MTNRSLRITAVTAVTALLITGGAHISAQSTRAPIDLSSEIGRFELVDRIEYLVGEQREIDIDLADYARTYGRHGPEGGEPDGDLVFGVYENIGTNVGAVTWTEAPLAPSIDDGDCAAVELTYSISEDEIVSLRCNGVA